MDMGGPTPYQQQQMMNQMPPSAPAAQPQGAIDLLGEGLDNLVRFYWTLFEDWIENTQKCVKVQIAWMIPQCVVRV